MVNYVKTTNGYFYKICKNGKKRISEDEYNKQRKIKKMTGGVEFEHINLLSDEMEMRNRNPKTLMDNVFATGHITIKNGINFSCITKISKELKNKLDDIKKNNNIIEYKGTKITYVGEIICGGGRIYDGFTGNSNIWVQLKNGFVYYIVEIKKIRNDDRRSYGKLVDIALKSLCKIQNIDLLIKALNRIKVECKMNLSNQSNIINKLIKITDKISTTRQHLIELQEKKALYLTENDIDKIDWTFTL
jgi:hypothetical protein